MAAKHGKKQTTNLQGHSTREKTIIDMKNQCIRGKWQLIFTVIIEFLDKEETKLQLTRRG